jgi:hypothetical protein
VGRDRPDRGARRPYLPKRGVLVGARRPLTRSRVDGRRRVAGARSTAHPLRPGDRAGGGSSPHQEWFDRHGEGLHHVGAVVESVDAAIATAAGQDIGVIASGEAFGLGGSGRFAYLDTSAALGMIVEVFEPPAGLGEPLRRI